MLVHWKLWYENSSMQERGVWGTHLHQKIFFLSQLQKTSQLCMKNRRFWGMAHQNLHRDALSYWNNVISNRYFSINTQSLKHFLTAALHSWDVCWRSHLDALMARMNEIVFNCLRRDVLFVWQTVIKGVKDISQCCPLGATVWPAKCLSIFISFVSQLLFCSTLLPTL